MGTTWRVCVIGLREGVLAGGGPDDGIPGRLIVQAYSTSGCCWLLDPQPAELRFWTGLRGDKATETTSTGTVELAVGPSDQDSKL